MKVLNDYFTIIIPHTSKDVDDSGDNKNYYTKAVLVEEDIFKYLDEIMGSELMYGEVEYC
jgi:hypothetical protein